MNLRVLCYNRRKVRWGMFMKIWILREGLDRKFKWWILIEDVL